MGQFGAARVVQLPMFRSRGGAYAPTTLTAQKSTTRVKGEVATKKARVFPPRAPILAKITNGLGAASKLCKALDKGGGKEPGRSGIFDDARDSLSITNPRESHGDLHRSISMFDFGLTPLIEARNAHWVALVPKGPPVRPKRTMSGDRPRSARGGEEHSSNTTRRNPPLYTSYYLGIEQIKLWSVQDFDA